MAFLSEDALAAIGFKAIGTNVLISDRASIYGAQNIRIGSNVRIDDFCILSAGEGGISIGSQIHIAAAATLIGHAAISLMDFSNISGRVSIYSSSDDYSGRTMTNPTVPDVYKKVDSQPVSIGRHVIVGCGSVILPGTALAEGCAIGALSLVEGEWEPFTILAGTPAKKRGDRARGLLGLEQRFKEAASGSTQ
jgi:acetyltransferase-like isoleucine patch superfamily enzyme